jgi:hypothetical protein
MIRALVCALLCTVGTIVPAKSDDDGLSDRPWLSPYFKDVQMMTYEGAIQSKGRCAVDWKAWNTAIDFVANQSIKLKLIREDDHHEQEKQLIEERNKATDKLVRQPNNNAAAQKELQKAFDEAQGKLNKYGWVPRMHFAIQTMDLVNSCVGTVSGTVDVVVETSKIKATDKTILTPSVEIWSNSRLLAGPSDTFASFAIQASEQIMKKLVNDWAKSQEF